MANCYTASSFMLPASWPEEAKELFSKLVEIAQSEIGEEKLKEFLNEEGIPEGSLTVRDIQWAHYTMTSDISNGNYCFYEECSFDPDMTQTLLDIVTEKFKIPYEHRIEFGYCWYCEKPRIDSFGGDTIVSYYEPLKYATRKIQEDASVRTVLRALAEENMEYDSEIESLEVSDRIKDALHMVRHALYKVNDEGINIMTQSSPKYRRIISGEATHGLLLQVLRDLEGRENFNLD